MQERARYSLSGALSLAVHAFVVLMFVWSLAIDDTIVVTEELPDWDIDFIEFEVKDIEPDAAQGEPEPEPEPELEPPAPEEAAPPPVEQPESPEGAAQPEPEPEAEPKPRFGEKKSKIGALVPPNATWTLVLANKRIKKLPFRDAATEIMAPLPDFRILVDAAGFNVWEDFEFIVMGSPDATDWTQAFVAVQYTFGHEEMKAGIMRAAKRYGMVVEWSEQDGVPVGDPYFADPDIEAKNRDERVYVLLPGDKVALYLRKEFLPQVIEGPSAKKGKTSGNFVANIARIRRFVAAEPKAGVQLIVEDLRSMISLGSDAPFEIPSRAELMWEAAKKPELVIKFDFLESEHADGAERFWNEELEDLLRQLKVWDGFVGGIVSAVELERDKRQLRLRYQFNETSAKVTLDAVATEFGRAMRWSNEKSEQARKEREEAWAAREGGKKLPSEVFDAEPEPSAEEPGSSEGGEPEPDEQADPEQPTPDSKPKGEPAPEPEGQPDSKPNREPEPKPEGPPDAEPPEPLEEPKPEPPAPEEPPATPPS